MVLDFKVSGDRIFCESEEIASGNENSVTAAFELDGRWSGYAVTAVMFRTFGTQYCVPLENGACPVPDALLGGTGRLYIGVFGSKGDEVITTGFTSVAVFGGASDGNVPEPPEAYVYTRLLDMVTQAIEGVNRLEKELLSRFESHESSCETAEADRSVAENSRRDAELVREENEEKRIAAEERRTAAESDVAAAEEKRRLAELERERREAERGDDYVRKDNTINTVYIRENGIETSAPFSSLAGRGGTFARRTSYGAIRSAEPRTDDECATKLYVDSALSALAPSSVSVKNGEGEKIGTASLAIVDGKPVLKLENT